MLKNRLQVLIDDDRLARLEQEAGRRNVPVAVLVREAIDAAFPRSGPSRREALEVIRAADPMPVGSPSELRAELEELRSRHG